MTFVKGKSGNPKGRPKKDVSITSILKDKLDTVPEIEVNGQPNKKTWRDLIAEAMLTKSAEGDIRTIQELLNRVEGRVIEKVEQTGEMKYNMSIRFVEKDNTEETKKLINEVVSGEGT